MATEPRRFPRAGHAAIGIATPRNDIAYSIAIDRGTLSSCHRIPLR